MTQLYLGFLQFDVQTGEIEANLDQVKNGLENLSQQGPGFVVLPELWAAGFDYPTLSRQAARTTELLFELQKLSNQYQLCLAGSLPEPAKSAQGEIFYNTLSIVGPQGVMGMYRKQNMFAPLAEDRYFTPGSSPCPMQTDSGPVAGLICYDLRFPELARHQVKYGAKLLLVSAQWPAVRIDHWQALLKARAIENQIYIAACNHCGTSGNTKFGGHSMIVGPDGQVLSLAGEKAEAGGLLIDTVLVNEIRARFNTAIPSPHRFFDRDKIIDLPKLAKLVQQYKEGGCRVVFTNGCFDLLHEGHVTYLEEARKQGDCLVVGLNTDASIRSIKGPERPVNQEMSRARVLAALSCVDHVVLFGEETPLNLITTLIPDVLVKGADWSVETIVGAREVMEAGGRVATINLVNDISTTGLIGKIRNKRS